MKDADQLIKEEAQYLRVAMGHESESLDEYVEAHNTCVNDLMYFATRNAYGLSSVAGNMEKLAALQNEFENLRSKFDDGKEKIVRLEKKAILLTQGYETRAKKSLWPQIEATFKQMDIAATELECFQALQKQEQLAASHRINNVWGEVQKQKELEKTLQKRYGDPIADLERVQNVMNQYRVKAQQEIEAKNCELESTEVTVDETNLQGTENGSAISVDPSHDETTAQQIDIVQDQATSSFKNDMEVDSCKEQTTHDTDVKLRDVAPVAEDDIANVVEVNETNSHVDNEETTVDMSASVEVSSIGGNKEDRDVENLDDAVEAVNQGDN